MESIAKRYLPDFVCGDEINFPVVALLLAPRFNSSICSRSCLISKSFSRILE